MVSARFKPVAVPHSRFISAIDRIDASSITQSSTAFLRNVSTEPSKVTPEIFRAKTTAPVSSAILVMTSGAPPHLWRNFTAESSPMVRLSDCRSPMSLSSPRASAARIISDNASRCNSCCSRPSTGLKPGTNPASSGKLASNDWQKPWIVMICKPPPGESSTLANSFRANLMVSAVASAPIARKSRAKSVPFICTHDANR